MTALQLNTSANFNNAISPELRKVINNARKESVQGKTTVCKTLAELKRHLNSL